MSMFYHVILLRADMCMIIAGPFASCTSMAWTRGLPSFRVVIAWSWWLLHSMAMPFFARWFPEGCDEVIFVTTFDEVFTVWDKVFYVVFFKSIEVVFLNTDYVVFCYKVSYIFCI